MAVRQNKVQKSALLPERGRAARLPQDRFRMRCPIFGKAACKKTRNPVNLCYHIVMKRILPLLAVAAFLACGCEKDDSDDFYIRASREKLCDGETCELVAHLSNNEDDKEVSGVDFSWSLSNPSIGHFAKTRGRHAEYVPTSFPAPGQPELVQTIRCKLHGDILNLFYEEGEIFNSHAQIQITHIAGQRK